MSMRSAKERYTVDRLSNPAELSQENPILWIGFSLYREDFILNFEKKDQG